MPEVKKYKLKKIAYADGTKAAENLLPATHFTLADYGKLLVVHLDDRIPRQDEVQLRESLKKAFGERLIMITQKAIEFFEVEEV